MSRIMCQNCGKSLTWHCGVHLVPCCPGRCVDDLGSAETVAMLSDAIVELTARVANAEMLRDKAYEVLGRVEAERDALLARRDEVAASSAATLRTLAAEWDTLTARCTAAEAICYYYDDPDSEDDAALGLYAAWSDMLGSGRDRAR